MSSERQQIVAVLLDFLEAVIHQLLFVRALYAPDLFERQRLYGVAVRKSRHPELNQYISEVVGSLQAPLSAGTLAKVAVVVSNAGRTPLERHVIQPKVLAPAAPAQQGAGQALDVDALQAQLRGVILKLQYADSYLPRLPPGCSFEVLAYTTDRRGVPQDTWVEEQPAPGTLELDAAEIVPIKSCAVDGAFQLQLYVESRRQQQQQQQQR